MRPLATVNVAACFDCCENDCVSARDHWCTVVPPKITTKMLSTEGVQGSNLNLSCRGTGLPQPKYEFLKV